MKLSRSFRFDVGVVLSVGDGVANVAGLERAMAGELVFFPKKWC